MTTDQTAGAELEATDQGDGDQATLEAFEDHETGEWLCLRRDERKLLEIVRQDAIEAPVYDVTPEEIRAAAAGTIVRLGRHRYNSPTQILRRLGKAISGDPELPDRIQKLGEAAIDEAITEEDLDIRARLERELTDATSLLAGDNGADAQDYESRAATVESIANALAALPTVDVADAEEKRRAIRQAAAALERLGQAIGGAQDLSFRPIHHVGPPSEDAPDDVGMIDSGRILPAGYEDLDPAAIAELSGKLYAIAGGPRPA